MSSTVQYCPLWYDVVDKCQRPIVKLVCIGDNIKLSTSYVTTFKQRRSVDMTIVHNHIMKTITVVTTVHVTIFLQEVMLMGALCVKSFIQIIFRRNMLLGTSYIPIFIQVFRPTKMLLTGNTLRNTHRNVIDMGEICTIGI